MNLSVVIGDQRFHVAVHLHRFGRVHVPTLEKTCPKKNVRADRVSHYSDRGELRGQRPERDRNEMEKEKSADRRALRSPQLFEAHALS